MSTESIDHAIYDTAHYESLRKRGISEDRAKRVATVPLARMEASRADSIEPTSRNAAVLDTDLSETASVSGVTTPR